MPDNDALAVLIEDHRAVQKLFKDFEKSKGNKEQKAQLVKQCCQELTIHAQIEEEIFYPAIKKLLEEKDLVNEATVEHASAKDLIRQLGSLKPDDEMYDASFTVLGEYINHHVKEEEEEMFPKVRKTKLDLQELGARLMQRKQALKQKTGIG